MVRSLAVAWALVLGLVTPIAIAGPREDAVVLADEGSEAMEQGEIEKAAAKFEAATKLYFSPVIALQWARAEAKLGHLVKARDVVSTIAKTPLEEDAQPSWKQAAADAAVLGRELDARIPTITVEVVGADDGRVVVDGARVAEREAVQVNPGAHQVVVTRANGERLEQQLEVVEGEKRKVGVDFGAGMDMPQANPSLVPPIIAFGAAGVAIVIGTVTGVIFLGKVDDLEQTCPNMRCAPEHEDLLSEAETLGNVSTVAWVLAGVGIAAGIVLLFVPLGEDQEPAIVVRGGPGSASLSLRF